MKDTILKQDNSEKCEAIIIGNNDLPLIEIKKSKEDLIYDNYEFGDDVKSSISNIFAQIPQTVFDLNEVANEKKLNGKYIVKFSEEVTKKLQSGDLKYLQQKDGLFKAQAIGKNKKIVEIGHLNKIQFNPTAIIAVGWQIMAIITAQKFLADINGKLESIDKGIKDILRFLELDKLSKIRGNFDYLYDIQNKIKLNKLNNKNIVAVQLEAILKEFYQDENFYLSNLSDVTKKLKIEEPGVFKREKKQIANKEQIQKFKEISYNIINILYGELKVLQLKASLQLDCDNDLESRINRFKEKAKEFVEKAINAFNSFKKIDTAIYMEELSNILYKEKNEINKLFIPLKKVEEEVQFRIANKESEVFLEAEIDANNKIVNLRKIQSRVAS